MVGTVEDDDMGVGQITTKKTMFGRIVFTFDGLEFETEEAARSDRKIIIERKRAEKAQQEAKAAQKEDQQRREREIAEIYARYDEAAEIITRWVQARPSAEQQVHQWGIVGNRDVGLSTLVDMDALSGGIYKVCREIALAGYEVISIAPVVGGVGNYHFPGGKDGGGAGWGYSFTQGVIITAKRRRDLGA
jgi:hypothetical protein